MGKGWGEGRRAVARGEGEAGLPASPPVHPLNFTWCRRCTIAMAKRSRGVCVPLFWFLVLICLFFYLFVSLFWNCAEMLHVRLQTELIWIFRVFIIFVLSNSLSCRYLSKSSLLFVCIQYPCSIYFAFLSFVRSLLCCPDSSWWREWCEWFS